MSNQNDRISRLLPGCIGWEESDPKIRTQSRTYGEYKVLTRTEGIFFSRSRMPETVPSPSPLSWPGYRRSSCCTWFCIFYPGPLVSGTEISGNHNKTSTRLHLTDYSLLLCTPCRMQVSCQTWTCIRDNGSRTSCIRGTRHNSCHRERSSPL